MTPIQEASLPTILQGHDVIAQAKTGSGKTVAFGLAMVNGLNVKQFRIQSMVLCPTRELANQVSLEIRKLARHIHNVKVLTLTGGVPYKPQVNSLFHGAHIIVGTPGRILKHLQNDNIQCEHLSILTLDEADKMLDMGFNEDINAIIDCLPQKRQTLLFSATYEEDIKQLSQNILNNPRNITVQNDTNEAFITEYFYQVQDKEKTTLLPSIFSTIKPNSVVIFCNMKITCDQLSDDLYDLGYDVLTLHSDLDQRNRDETLTLFANKSYPILIATDVAARGLHIDDVDLVINYDISPKSASHVHRTGRTARAGKSGTCINFIGQSDEDNFENLQAYLQKEVVLQKAHFEDDLSFKLDAPFRCLDINGGKKSKLRAGDILGALIQGVGLNKEDIGKIDIFPYYSYVAIKKEVFQKAYTGLEKVKIKGKFFKIYNK
jgi:ATP-independent RNA helicase DbpA